ncbi:kinase-like domain-containing protein [Glomus cerebriforme]|uniref:Kinase-like domain-containing protein n=1 Tax=Glomus cerebriforme TaxID=658196 RepID=A0A397SP91_9GLOM|nr:kinase-like domain-containing protein [Glomus cerebriforme]
MKKLDVNLRTYLQQNHNQLTWKERVQITNDIICALSRIHHENAVHRDLHSGNILYSNDWFISDFGFCGPVDKPLGSIYGNLPYIAPEVIVGEGYTFASDIYSIAMLMWEISSGQPPFANYENDYDLAMNIVNGMRPKIVSGTPLEYKKLMKRCWDANPRNRPSIDTLLVEIREINIPFYEQQKYNSTNMQSNINSNINTNSTELLFRRFSSKIYNFKYLPEPKNASEGRNSYILIFSN